MTRIIKELRPYKRAVDIFSRFKDETDAVILESSLENSLGRYTIIGRSPYLKIEKGKSLTINGVVSPLTFDEYVKTYLQNHREDNPTSLPLVDGAIGYFSYEYRQELENIARRHQDDTDIPRCILNFYDEFIIEDLKEQKVWLIANGHNQRPKQAIAQLEQEIAQVKPQGWGRGGEIALCSDFTEQEYLAAVKKMIQYIVEGDIYIANMTQHLSIESPRNPYEVFLRLRHINPSPFGGYLNYGDFKIISASPERFLKLENNIITTRPIKGTRKRGNTPNEDNLLKEELKNSGKDKSELLMIVDLERNDLNRVCIPGTVQVTELFAIEEYATVFHLVSTIEGELKPECNAMDLIKAAFPGGSITGAPKIRAMEIIDELEHSARNIYTGSLGYISLDGTMDLNIIIRTLLYKDGLYHLGVGGGITFESEPEFEYEETWQKAKAILEALK